MESRLERRCNELVLELGLGPDGGVIGLEPLSGGVASDIAVVDLGDQKICAKFALSKLKVAEDWRAPIHRNRAEYEWLRVAARVAPESAIRLLGCSESENGFAMEYVEGDDVSLWKSALLAGHVSRTDSALVGDLLGRIHNASTLPNFDTTPFHNRDDFRSLRIDPYLTFTATRLPELAGELNDLAESLFQSSQVLIHGDVSPKNILFRDGHPIILDAECATMGDASFDASFCLNHLVLKAVHLPESRDALFESVRYFWNAYAAHVTWEPLPGLEKRVCRLIPALMLARIDGKSPVEYLNETERKKVRALSVSLMNTRFSTLNVFIRQLDVELEENSV